MHAVLLEEHLISRDKIVCNVFSELLFSRENWSRNKIIGC